MHTLAAFYASVVNGTALGAVAGVADQSLVSDSSSRIKVPGPWKLLAALGIGVNLSRVQIDSPSLRNVFLPEVYPNVAAAAPPATLQITCPREDAVQFVSGDFFFPRVSRAGADAQPVAVLAWIGPQFVPAPPGRTFSLWGTSTPTLTAGTWVLSNPVWDQQLPVGTYNVVGMTVIANDAFGARLVFPGGAQFRPGVVVTPAYGNIQAENPFRMGEFGLFGSFAYDAPPQIEVLGIAAGAEAVVTILDLVKA